MAKAYDIELNASGDLNTVNGDLSIAFSDPQHIEDTIRAHAGWWKENYADGVGISDYLGSSGKGQEVARKIKLELQSDGYRVENPSVTITPDKVEINPNAIRD